MTEPRPDVVLIHPDFLRDVLRDASKAMTEFTDAMRGLNATFAMTAAELATLTERFRDLAKRHRRGHRHRGMRDWRLRYAPARKDVPLGLRTIAKVRSA